MTIIFISRDREQLGQFSEEEVREGLQTGRFLSTDLGWKEGMAEWKPLSTFGLESPAGAIISPASNLPVPAAPEGEWPAWDNAAAVGYFQAWWSTSYEALFSPIASFSKMKTTGGYGSPLLYAVICAALAGLVAGLFQGVLTFATTPSMEGAEGAGLAAMACSIPLAVGSTLVGSIIGVIIGSFLSAGIMHLILMLLGGANKGFETTYRAITYSLGAINTLQVVPCLGALVSMFWGPVVYCIALKEAQQTDYTRAIVAVLTPIVLCCALLGVGVFAMWGVIMAAMGELPNMPVE